MSYFITIYIPCKPKSWKIHGRVSTIGFSKTCRYITGKYCRYPGFGAISLIFASTWLLKTQPGHFHHAGLLNVRCSAICHLLLAQNMLKPFKFLIAAQILVQNQQVVVLVGMANLPFDASGLGAEWENVDSIRTRLREGKSLVDRGEC